MKRRFLYAGLLTLIYLLAAGALIVLSIMISVPLTIITVILAIIGLVPVLNLIARQTLCFQGVGDPVAPDELRQRLLTINDWDAPVMVQQTAPHTFAVTWRYLDARWWEHLAKAGRRELYTLHIKINDAQREVVLIDTHRSVTWGVGPSNVRVSAFGSRGVTIQRKFGAQGGVRENFTVDEIYNFTFSDSEIKTPVMNTILQSGWDVRMAIW